MIKIFVGCASNNEDLESQAVLEYSLKKHSSQPVDITWMQLSKDKNSMWNGWATELWATPFSGFRWAIPAACDYQGKAIYMDSDMIILDDITKLYNQEFEEDRIVLAKGGEDSWRYCVSLWNCEAAKDVLPEIDEIKSDPSSHRKLMAYFGDKSNDLTQPFNGNWNCVDGENLTIDKIQILHYSFMSTQFHHKYSLPRLQKEGKSHWYDGQVMPHPRKDLQELFDKFLKEPIESGYKPENYIKEPYGEYKKESQKNYNISNAHKSIR